LHRPHAHGNWREPLLARGLRGARPNPAVTSEFSASFRSHTNASEDTSRNRASNIRNAKCRSTLLTANGSISIVNMELPSLNIDVYQTPILNTAGSSSLKHKTQP
jgi:hypothetical protein